MIKSNHKRINYKLKTVKKYKIYFLFIILFEKVKSINLYETLTIIF